MVGSFVLPQIYRITPIYCPFGEIRGINMKNDEWKVFVGKSETFLETETGAALAVAVGSLITIGNDDKDQREMASESIKTMFRGKEGNPFGRRGKGVFTPEQEIGLNNVLEPLGNALAEAFNAHPLITELVLPHGRTKATSFDGESFATSIVDKAMNVAKGLAKDGNLDQILI